MFQKNQEYEIEIDDIGAEGEGIGHIDNFAVFVKGGLPGDLMLVNLTIVKKSYAHAKQIRLLKESPLRVIPKCPASGYCGGCHLQHCSYAGQIDYKTNKVKAALTRIGGLNDISVHDTLGMQNPYNYRNKVQFQVQWKDGKAAAGFYALRSHILIPAQTCNIQHPLTEKVMPVIMRFIQKNNLSVYDEASHTGLVRHIIIRTGFHTSDVMVCMVINGKSIPNENELSSALQATDLVKTLVINVNRQRTSVVMGTETRIVYGSGIISDYIGDLQFQISANSFFQVNSLQARLLYDQLLRMASFTGNEIVIDVYCGIGSISLYIAKYVRHVYGIEHEPQAVADANKNAALNSIQNVEFICGDSDRVFNDLLVQRNIQADIVIVDPPRKGCSSAILQSINEMHPKKIIYVSCDPATLARDLKILHSSGFHPQEVQPVDMFPQTAHVECVVLLSRKGD